MQRRFSALALIFIATACASSADSQSTSVAPSTQPVITTTTLPADPQLLDRQVIGYSTLGRPIEAIERGTPGGKVVVVVGAIHGDEDAGMQIVSALEDLNVPIGVDLWLIPTVNPDGVALQQRGTSNGVDMNRNFPYNWGPIAQKGNWEWAGPSAASEPETQATVEFMTRMQPELVVWYHQDLFCISPSTGKDGEIRALYSQLTGIPLKRITGGTYTGVAATWQRNTIADSIGFVVELGENLSDPDALLNANAVLAVAQKL